MTITIGNLSEIYLEISSNKNQYRYLSAADADDGSLESSDFVGPNEAWLVERQKGDGDIITGDLLWIKSKAVGKYLSHGVDGFMMRLVDNKGIDELWPIGDGRHGIPVESGQPTLFPPIYRGCVWLAAHMDKTETVVRIFNGHMATSTGGIPIVNGFGKEVKFIFDTGIRRERVNIDVPDSGIIFLGVQNEPRDTIITHYCNSSGNRRILSQAVIPDIQTGQISVERNGSLNIINQ